MNEYLLFLLLFFAGLAVRNGYEVLKKRGSVDSRNKIVFTVVFAAMCMMWAGWFEMCPRDPWKAALPGWLKWSGLGIVVLGFGLALGSLFQLRGVENIQRLVSGGLYSKIRHPMYTGFMLWIPGWALYHGASASLLAGLTGIAGILFWQKLEEESLASQFGDTYLRYRRRTWF